MNDADETGDRESMLCYSPNNDGNSWADVSLWSYTWIGNSWEPVGVGEDDHFPDSYTLYQNYPNPFNPATNIHYYLPEESHVKLNIYNVMGQKVAELLNETQSVGKHEVKFNTTNFVSGVYFLRIEAGQFVESKKMILLK